MQSLEPPDSHFVSAAVGWVELGNWREAAAELSALSPFAARLSSVLILRYEIHAHEGQWNEAADAAAASTETTPDEPGAWCRLAYATRRKPDGGLPAAKEILSAARERFPSEALIAYNLACYECQLGNLPQARALLQDAFKLPDSAELKRLSMDDRDLEPLRPEIILM